MCAAPYRVAPLLALWVATGLAASEPAPAPALTPVGPPVDAAVLALDPAITRCSEPGSDQTAVIDKVQRGVYKSICSTAVWFDGLFGNPRYDQDSDDTFGRVSVFENYDRRDDFDTRLRLRARYAFPNLKNRIKLTLGRGDEQELVEQRPGNSGSPAPSSFQTVEDDAWLLGLGYSKQGALENGFDFATGIRLNTPIDPYVKATYRHNWVFRGDTLLRFRETPFWRDSRGFGATTQFSVDHLATDRVMLRWNNFGTVAEDTEALEWGTSFTAYQSRSRRRAISYTALLRGETGADVPIQNYGVETRYRRNIARKWLFMDLSASLTWPREELDEEREINPGVGIGFEMYFGPVPELDLR